MTAAVHTSSIRRLRESPVPIDAWRLTQVGDTNDGPYKKGYQAIDVREEGANPLVDVSRYGLVSAELYLDRILDGDRQFKQAQEDGVLFSRALLREHHARRLVKADSYLRANGLFLYVRSGWRHPRVQRIAMDAFARREGPDAARRLFAEALPNAAPPPHSTGAAFDVELVQLDTGQHLPMCAVINAKEIFGLYRLEQLASADPTLFAEGSALGEALRNRRVLFHVLCTVGVVFAQRKDLFAEHPGEFWHFGDGDPLSAYLRRESFARCGLLYPTEQAYFRAMIV
jgi:D-alanyl-D-alanine dipeptidase